MATDFYFKQMLVGHFDDPTCEPGTYQYVADHSAGHQILTKAVLESEVLPRCSYTVDDQQVSFAVVAFPEPGLIELRDFENEPVTHPQLGSRIDNWSPDGCAACRESIAGKHGPPLVKIIQSTSQDALLYRCEKCGACWLSSEGETKVIPCEDARQDFPEAFSDERPSDDNYDATNTYDPPPLHT